VRWHSRKERPRRKTDVWGTRQQKISQAKYRLHFHLAVTKEGDVSWRDSEWRLERSTEGKSVYGTMDNLEKETTAFCGAVLGGGGSVSYLGKN